MMPPVLGSRPLGGCPSQLPLSPEAQLNVSLTKEMVIRFNLAFLLRSLFAEALRSLLRLPVTFSDGCDTLLLGFWLCVRWVPCTLTPDPPAVAPRAALDLMLSRSHLSGIVKLCWGDIVSGLAEISGDLTGNLHVLWCLTSNGFVLV